MMTGVLDERAGCSSVRKAFEKYIMKRKIRNKHICSLCFGAMAFSAVPMLGQKVQADTMFLVRGVLIDSLSQEKEPYATIRVVRPTAPDQVVRMAVTDLNGTFQLPLPAEGTYRISISSMGKRTLTREFTCSLSQRKIDLGTLYTSETAEVLKNTEVVAQKLLVKAEIDRLSYNVEDDPDAQTNTTLEMLRKVPLVTVDGEDNIQVNGSGSFKVYVNGKPNTLMSNNPKEVLRSMPASVIKRIEVITDPGAKYDAEGVGGILNIVTADTRMQGYNATLGVQARNTGAGGNAYVTAQAGKFTVSANYSYNYHSTPTVYNTTEREDFTSEEFRHLYQDGTSKSDGSFQFGSLEASYEVDTLNLISLSATLFDGKFSSDENTLIRMNRSDQTQRYGYNMLAEAKNNWMNLNLNLDYQHTFRKPGELLTLSYKLNTSPNGKTSDTRYEDLEDVPYALRRQSYDNDAHTAEHTAQVDYVLPVNEMHSLDAGMKYIYRLNSSDSRSLTENDEGVMVENSLLSSQYDQGQNILAAYADYQLKWKRMGLRAGVRYEHTFMNVEYALQPERNFQAGFNDWVPSMNLSYMLNPTSSLRLNYNMRINRPGIWYLNPFRDTSNPNSVSYGNPDLDTEKAHITGLAYSYFSAQFSVNANLSYRYVGNGIESYSFMKDGVQETTYGNVCKTHQTTLSVWANWNPGSKTRLSVNLSGDHSVMRSEELAADNRGFSGNLFLNAQQTLPWELRLSLFGGGSTPRVSLQGTGASYYFYGLNLSRSFLKEKRLNVSLYANNFFKKYQITTSETVTESFRTLNKSKYSAMNFGCSISWRFGDLKAQVKKTERSIQNDDVKSGGNNTGAGTGAGMENPVSRS